MPCEAIPVARCPLPALCAAVVLAAGCPPEAPTPGVEVPTRAICQQLTWSTVGLPTTWTWCTPCHSALLEGADRQGAPAGVDFDTYRGTVAALDGVERVLAPGAAAPMPPEGRPPTEDTDRLLQWIACGAPR